RQIAPSTGAYAGAHAMQECVNTILPLDLGILVQREAVVACREQVMLRPPCGQTRAGFAGEPLPKARARKPPSSAAPEAALLRRVRKAPQSGSEHPAETGSSLPAAKAARCLSGSAIVSRINRRSPHLRCRHARASATGVLSTSLPWAYKVATPT